MSLIADGLLIVTCLTTAIYCYVLSRRLKRLANTDEGIGQQITQFNAALDETRTAYTDLKGEAQRASDRLIKEVAAARKVAAKLQVQMEEAKSLKVPTYQASPAPAAAAAIAVAEAADLSAQAIDEDVVEDEIDDDIPAHPTLGEMEEEPLDEDERDVGFDEFDTEEGEQQLGFLPDVDISADDEITELEEDEEEDAPEAIPLEAENPNDLLKVERMAL